MAFNWDDHPVEDKKATGTAGAFNWDTHPVETNERSLPSELESGLRGAAQGVTFGFADEAAGGLEAAKDWITNDPSGFMANYRKHRNESRANYKSAEQANPASYMSGQFGGAVVPALFTSGGSIPASIGSLAAQGAAQGLGSSESDLMQGDLSGAVRDTALGSAIGGATGVAGKAISKIPFQKAATYIGDKLGETAERLAARGLGAERGTIKKLGDEEVRAAGRYALDEGIVTPLASTDDMIARNSLIQRDAGNQMGSVYKTIDDAGASTFNPLDVATKVEKKVGDFWRSPINRGETRQLENTLDSILMRSPEGGNIPLSEAQILKQELGKVANWKNKVSITDKEKMARDAYGVVSSAIDEATEQGANKIEAGGLKETLQEAKNLFSKSKTAEELLENKNAREQGNRLFGLTDNIIGGASIGAAPATGGASLAIPIGKKVIERYGINTGATLADNLSDIVARSPQALGKFAKPLQDAAARGATSLAATNFVLQQTNPEYRQMILKSPDEQEE